MHDPSKWPEQSCQSKMTEEHFVGRLSADDKTDRDKLSARAACSVNQIAALDWNESSCNQPDIDKSNFPLLRKL